MSWSALANNQTVSCNNLQDAVNNGVFTLQNTIPVSNKQINKSEAEYYVYINDIAKLNNQLVVKSNLVSNVGTNYITAIDGNPGYIYRSTDGGVSWNALTSVGSNYWTSIGMSRGGQYQSTGGATAVLRTSNNYGATWTPDTDPYQDPYSLGVSSTGQYQIYAPDFSYVKYSSDYGVTFRNSSTSGQWWYGCVAISGNGQYALAAAGGGGSTGYGFVQMSTNYGVDFTRISGAINSSAVDWEACAISNDGMYQVVCQNGGYSWKSTDYGVTWTQITLIGGTGTWRTACISSTGKYWIIGDYGHNAYLSSDYGITWSTSSLGALNFKASAMSTSGQHQYLAVQNGYLYCSSDYGSSWVAMTSAGSRYWNGIAVK